MKPNHNQESKTCPHDSISAGVTVSPALASGARYGFHWSTAAGGGGSITNYGTPDANVYNSINKARKEEYDYRQWFSDYNNMLGDITLGFSNINYSPTKYREYASPINKVTTFATVLSYWDEAKNIANNEFADQDWRDLHVNAMRDVGAYVGGIALGSIMAGVFAETGPGAAYAGVWGTVMGAQLGREVFGYIGGCYYDMFVASGINKQLQELIRYNRTYYPIIYPLF